MIPENEPILPGQTYRHDPEFGGLLYQVDDVRPDTTNYEVMHNLTGSTIVNYTQLEQGSYPPGAKWAKVEPEFRAYFTAEALPHHPSMNDIYDVGPEKPMGHLPLTTITGICGEDIDEVIARSQERGLVAFVQTNQENPRSKDALHVYDRESLAALLQVNGHVLRRAGWPSDPDKFVMKCTREVADIKRYPDLFTLIAWAHRDKRPEFQRPEPVYNGTLLEQPRVPEFQPRSQFSILRSLISRK